MRTTLRPLLLIGLLGASVFWQREAWAGWRNHSKTFSYGGVTAIAEDLDGNLYFATYDEGVVSYNGTTWTNIRATDGLGSDDVSDVIVDRAGRIWCATRAGISVLDRGFWTSYTSADGLPETSFHRSLFEDLNGSIWVISDIGPGSKVNRLDGSWWTTVRDPAGEIDDFDVGTMFQKRTGELWFLGRRGFSRFDGEAWINYRYYSSGWLPAYIGKVIEDRSGNVWASFGNGNGVAKFDGNEWTRYVYVGRLANAAVYSLIEGRDGDIWVGTNRGISRFDGSDWTSFSVADGLQDSLVTRLIQDRDGVVWAFTTSSEWPQSVRLHWFNGRTWSRVQHSPLQEGSREEAIFADRLGNFWFPRTLAPVRSFDRSHWASFSTTEGVAGAPTFFTAASRDSSGNLWFGTDHGVSRFDGSSWVTYRATDGLPADYIHSITTDRYGNVWFGTGGHVTRFDGRTWTTYSDSDGIPPDDFPKQFAQDDQGRMWFASFQGAVRFDGVRWQTFTERDGLCHSFVFSMTKDGSGKLWFLTIDGICTFDGENWERVTIPNGFLLSGGWVHADRSGNVWVVSGGGALRWDGTNWTVFEIGRVDWPVVEDDDGRLWFSTYNAVLRFDGSEWVSFTKGEEIGDGREVAADPVLSDREGGVWLVGPAGFYRFITDHTAPRTVLLARPPRVSASSSLSLTYSAGFGETNGISFSHRVDEGPWSTWNDTGLWTGYGLADGEHVFEARTRDRTGNVDPFRAMARFTIDTTPPTPILSSPHFGDPVRGTIIVGGTATDARFSSYRLDFRPTGTVSSEEAILITQSTNPVGDGPLATWETTALADGSYDLRLSVTDSLGLTGSTIVSVVVDNQAPYFDETAPVKITTASGGHVYTTNGEAHIYFPPHAFEQDAVVMVAPLAAVSVPVSLPSGATKVLDGHEIVWAGVLDKPARLTMSYRGIAIPAGTLSLYRSTDGATWERLGGTVEPEQPSVSLLVSLPGRYALFVDNGSANSEVSLSPIELTPRVFSPTGGFADRRVGIGFRLGQPAPVTVKVFSRSGRLIREVVSAAAMNSGDNVVFWDGRDRNGSIVVDDLYLVTIEALGHRQTKTLAVVR